MKKLGKIKLKSYREIDDSEMKCIVGGYGTGGTDPQLYWWRCVCSQPTSYVVSGNYYEFFKAYAASEAVELMKPNCTLYNHVRCDRDKPVV